MEEKRQSRKRNTHTINKIILLPSGRTGINLLYSCDNNFNEGFEDAFKDMISNNYSEYTIMSQDGDIISNQEIKPICRWCKGIQQ